MKSIPDANTFEVSLIGTGGGYGESIVIHLGDNNWIVVDSCINPFNKACLPLEYLISKGVDIANNVKLIVCTHWHDDHIQGISELLSKCDSAVFSIAKATDKKKFLQFVGLDFNKCQYDVTDSSTIEINKCFDIIKNRNSSIKGSEQDKLLLSLKSDNITSKVFSLSPSDYVINEFDSEISALITEYGTTNKKIVIQTPNDKSVALLIKVNDHSVLLGSDLEVSTSTDKGWLCILDKCQCIDSKSSLFKIPHHGSKTGYIERVWADLLTPKAVAKLTPWNMGSKLPNKEMLETYLAHTDDLFSTSTNPISNNPKARERSISKAISKFNNTVKEVKYHFGVVRCRIDSLDKNAQWIVDLYGEASRITTQEDMRTHNQKTYFIS